MKKCRQAVVVRRLLVDYVLVDEKIYVKYGF